MKGHEMLDNERFLKSINDGDKYFNILSKTLLSYISHGIDKGYIDKYVDNISISSIDAFDDAWLYLQKRVPLVYGFQAPLVKVLSVTPKVREVYGLPSNAEARYLPELQAIVVQNKKQDQNIFNSVLVHEYTHYIQDVLGMLSHNMSAVLCPKCNSSDVLLSDLGKDIWGQSNSAGYNVTTSQEVQAVDSDDNLSCKSNIKEYFFLDNGLEWIERDGWNISSLLLAIRFLRSFTMMTGHKK